MVPVLGPAAAAWRGGVAGRKGGKAPKKIQPAHETSAASRATWWIPAPAFGRMGSSMIEEETRDGLPRGAGLESIMTSRASAWPPWPP